MKAALAYAKESLRIEDMAIFEGSGISRQNRISAQHMHRILEAFAPYHHLMRSENREYYKTGTLYGISTRAGYIVGKKDGLYRYVIMINSPGKSAKAVMRKLLQVLD